MKLEIKKLIVSYEQMNVIDELSLCVNKGEFFTILGHSGSGKSTILKAIAGLVEAKGSILLDEIDIGKTPAEKRDIAFVFQKPLLFPHLTVEKNISFGLEIHKWKTKAIEERVQELLELLYISDLGKRMPNELSGGQQQRVAIARAMALNPKIILMDEPFSSLDPELRRDLGELIKFIQKKLKLTIVFVTHDANEALLLSDQIAFLQDKVVQQVGTSDELYYKPKTKVIGDFFGKANYMKEEQLLFVRPHQIEITSLPEQQLDLSKRLLVEKATLIKINKVGKECRLIFSKNNKEIYVEYYGTDEFMIEKSYNLIIKKHNLHYIPFMP